ncbi:MAG: hypothetical protein HQ494_02710 [Rhodospirillales bacterium]|nr:hypothetical protein [Rhodospirillales bacterium]
MTGSSENIRSLEWLHGQIEANPALGAEEAAKQLINDIKAIADKMIEDAEVVVSRIHAEAESATIKLAAETAKSVANIRKESTRAASDLILNGKAAAAIRKMPTPPILSFRKRKKPSASLTKKQKPL